MGARCIILFLPAFVFLAACEKNSGSKIPHIELKAFTSDPIRVNLDTAYIEFSLTDGDADIGNDTNSVIYLMDSRFPDLGYSKVQFPIIDGIVEDPNKGLEGTCLFYPLPQPVPRDSLHSVTGDTLTYELYITDRANHASNHITTPQLIVKP